AGGHSGRGAHRMMPRPTREPTGMGLRPRSGGLGARLRSLFSGVAASAEAWDDVEEALIAADIGPEAAITLVDEARTRSGRGGDPSAIPDAGLREPVEW